MDASCYVPIAPPPGFHPDSTLIALRDVLADEGVVAGRRVTRARTFLSAALDGRPLPVFIASTNLLFRGSMDPGEEELIRARDARLNVTDEREAPTVAPDRAEALAKAVGDLLPLLREARVALGHVTLGQAMFHRIDPDLLRRIDEELA